MPTTGIVDGTLIRIKVAGEKVVHATSSNLSTTMETTEVSSKDTGGGSWTETSPGKLSFAGGAEALFSFDDTINSEARKDYEALFDAMVARDPVAITWTTGVTGDVEFSGSAYITNLEMTAPNSDSATFSFQITGTGALTKATIS